MISDLASYRRYFANLATQMGLHFVWATNGRVLNRQLSQVTYPMLWCPVPDISMDRTEGDRYKFSGAIVLLTNCPADDLDAQDRALEKMLDTARQAIVNMADDAEDQFAFDPDAVPMEQVSFWSADNDWGWKLEFEIISGTICC